MSRERPDIAAILESLAHPALPVIDMSLARVRALLAALGNPEKRLPPVVHVAGTNGKGSLLAYLKAMLEAGGYRVHRYTSPHLVRFNERIHLAGQDIDDDYLLALLQRIAPECKQLPITYFEATTALAFLAFTEVKADVLLLETGMGGRLDATNVLDAPALTAITPVSMDHTEFLGSNLATIAAEKAGILKPGVACVVGPQQPEALGVIQRAAEEKHCPLLIYGRDWTAEASEGGMLYRSGWRELRLTLPALAGAHQVANAGTAIACIENLPGFVLSEQQMEAGLTSVRWPARLQRLAEGSLAALLPPSAELWLDGGHNEGAGRELALWIRQQAKKVHLVCGMQTTKDVSAFLTPMAPYVSSLVGVAIEGSEQSRQAADISASAREAGIKSMFAYNIKNAIEHIVKNNDNDIIILVCGSLLLAGNTLWQNGTRV